MAGTHIHLIISVTFAFVAALFGVVSLLSFLRRRRNPPKPSVAEIFAPLSDETRPMSAVDDTQQFMPLGALTTRLMNPNATPKRAPLPNIQRPTPQANAAEPVVLSIDPIDGPTRDERNIQKLIEFLKQADDSTAETEPIQRVG